MSYFVTVGSKLRLLIFSKSILLIPTSVPSNIFFRPRGSAVLFSALTIVPTHHLARYRLGTNAHRLTMTLMRALVRLVSPQPQKESASRVN